MMDERALKIEARDIKRQQKKLQSKYKKAVRKRFLSNGKIILPDGEGDKVEVFEHNGAGILITKKVADLIKADVAALYDQSKDQAGYALIYENPENKNILGHEFQARQGHTIHYYCRCRPWDMFSAELHARGYEIEHVGLSAGPIQSALHLTTFEVWHSMLTPRISYW